MLNKKIVWRAASKFKGDFSMTELVEELSKEMPKKDIYGERFYYRYRDIVKVVTAITGITERELFSRTKKRSIVKARQVGMYLVYKYTHFSTVITGDIFNRDHATVIHARKVVKDALDGFDPLLKDLLDRCEKGVLMEEISYVKDNEPISREYKSKEWKFDREKILEMNKNS